MRKRIIVLLGVMLVVFGATAAAAIPTMQEHQMQRTWEAAMKVRVKGPAEIRLADQAVLKLPPNMIYIPQPQAGEWLVALGNSKSEQLIGLITTEKEDEHWFVTIKYDKAGYIKDDEAKNWKVEELFDSIKEGTEEGNKERRQRGIAEWEIIGWIEKPQYDSVRHQLIWSISMKDKGVAATPADTTINYNTYVLGRQGYLKLDLVTDIDQVEAQKPMIKTLLDNTHFVSGKRYEDFNSMTDKVAEYGLAALIGGVAVKKAGLLAGVMVFIAKFAKAIMLLVGGGAVAIAKFFGFKKGNDDKNDLA